MSGVKNATRGGISVITTPIPFVPKIHNENIGIRIQESLTRAGTKSIQNRQHYHARDAPQPNHPEDQNGTASRRGGDHVRDPERVCEEAGGEAP